MFSFHVTNYTELSLRVYYTNINTLHRDFIKTMYIPESPLRAMISLAPHFVAYRREVFTFQALQFQGQIIPLRLATLYLGNIPKTSIRYPFFKLS